MKRKALHDLGGWADLLTGEPEQPLVEFLIEQNINLPHACYQLTLGVLKTCDTCWVRVNGKLVRSYELQTFDGLKMSMQGQVATAARHESTGRILAKHQLSRTVCENNTADCTSASATRKAYSDTKATYFPQPSSARAGNCAPLERTSVAITRWISAMAGPYGTSNCRCTITLSC